VFHAAEGEVRPEVADAVLALQLGDAINALVRRAEVVVGKFRFVAARFVRPAALPSREKETPVAQEPEPWTPVDKLFCLVSE